MNEHGEQKKVERRRGEITGLKKRQALQAEAGNVGKLTQMFAGAGGAEAGASTSAPAGDDSGGGRQMDEVRGRQEEERRVAAAEFELKVRK